MTDQPTMMMKIEQKSPPTADCGEAHISKKNSPSKSEDTNKSIISSLSEKRTIPPRPPNREVARPVQNLGNTCYMNAVLQALAHAPELCLAMDVYGHRTRCPIYKENCEKTSARSASSTSSSTVSSRSSSPDTTKNDGVKSVYTYQATTGPTGTRKSSRRAASRTNSPTENAPNGCTKDLNATKFCALCEVEQHMDRVHRNLIVSKNGSEFSTANSKPVVPTDFVHGFIEHVAPERFRVGQQEDSHEFLRLLIEAMQKSCKIAKKNGNEAQETNVRRTRIMIEPSAKGNTQDISTDPSSYLAKETIDNGDYPFQLFSGKIESKVTCGHCNTTSSTLDPIEDLGLEVAPVAGAIPPRVVGGRRNTFSPILNQPLVNVSHSLQKFACAEDLDASYKCESCGMVGRATKQMRLASVPPIITLHLKRFRYGSSNSSLSKNVSTSTSVSNGPPMRRSQRQSEVGQLLASSGNSASARTDWFGGTSGSAKIEGHIGFADVLDLKPYLTEKLQEDHPKNLLSRLFAVIVHVGKNSHSGHYLAYVRNISKNEWWKMDDSRVTSVPASEVLNANAYMLFYRVVKHPYCTKLLDKIKALNAYHDSADAKAENVKKEKVAASGSIRDQEVSNRASQLKSVPASNVISHRSSFPAGSGPAGTVKRNPRKRKAPEYTCGEDWARQTTIISEKHLRKFRHCEANITKIVEFTQDYNKLLTEHSLKINAKVGHGPSLGVSLSDDCGHECMSNVRQTLLQCFCMMKKKDKMRSFAQTLRNMATRSANSTRVKN